MRARAVCGAIASAALLAVIATAVASAAPTPPGSPLAGLMQARIEVGALEGQANSASATGQLRSVEADLAAAVVPVLWIDSSHPVAPPYGATVFAHSRAALLGLGHVPMSAVPASAVSGVVRSVLAADRSLALAAIRQA